MTNKSTHGEINNSTSTKHEFCEVHKMFYNFSEWTCTVYTLFALQRIFDGFNHFKNDFFYVKLIKKYVVLHGLKL